MRTFLLAWRVAACLSVLVVARPASAQVTPTTISSPRPLELAGLYRMESPMAPAMSEILFLRLFPNGRSRVESVVIDTKGESVRTSVKVGGFHRWPWRLKTLQPGASPYICFEIKEAESCTAFHQEGPRRDLLLFGPDAAWGSPTLILRRQDGDHLAK
jgi:hypothetical protein